MSKDQRLYLQDLQERVDRILGFAALGESEFRNSSMMQDAIIRNFEVIGEIIKRLDDDLFEQQSHVRWHDWAGFRDVLIHQYDKVVLQVVWKAICEDLPTLKHAVQAMLIQFE